MQGMLIQAGYNLGSSGADGKFGNKTQAAIKDFQKKTGCTVDGKVGNQTMTVLAAAVKAPLSAGVDLKNVAANAKTGGLTTSVVAPNKNQTNQTLEVKKINTTPTPPKKPILPKPAAVTKETTVVVPTQIKPIGTPPLMLKPLRPIPNGIIGTGVVIPKQLDITLVSSEESSPNGLQKNEKGTENLKYQLLEDYSILGGLTFISENVIHDIVTNGDVFYKSLKGVDSGLAPVFKYGGKAAPFVSIALDARALVTEEISGKSIVHIDSIYYAMMGPYGVIPAAKNVAVSAIYSSLDEGDREVIDWAMSTRGFSDTVTMPPDMYAEVLEQIGRFFKEKKK